MTNIGGVKGFCLNTQQARETQYCEDLNGNIEHTTKRVLGFVAISSFIILTIVSIQMSYRQESILFCKNETAQSSGWSIETTLCCKVFEKLVFREPRLYIIQTLKKTDEW